MEGLQHRSIEFDSSGVFPFPRSSDIRPDHSDVLPRSSDYQHFPTSDQARSSNRVAWGGPEDRITGYSDTAIRSRRSNASRHNRHHSTYGDVLSKRYNRTCLILNWIEAARGAQMRKLWEGLEVWRDSAVNEKAGEVVRQLTQDGEHFEIERRQSERSLKE